ncbi:MAG: hypothetical protein U1G07_17945 [Verrucomicrobiota bacterium]
MKTHLPRRARPDDGYAMLLTLVLGAVTMTVLAGALNWSANNLRLNSRSNQYFRTVAAAEAATESVVTRLTSDYYGSGDAYIQSRLDNYRAVIPIWRRPVIGRGSVWQ